MSKLEKVKFKFFNILQLGFYNNENSKHFPDYKEVLQDLDSWAKKQEALINTECYEKDEDNNIYGTYFYDYYEFNDKKDGILILWNEIESGKGGIFSIDQFAKPGKGKIETASLGVNSIPGRPSYYWFNYEKNIISSMIFEGVVSKKENLERYIFGFLKNHSKFKLSTVDSEGVKIENYIDPDSEEDINSSYPLVKISMQKNENLKNDILKRYKDIRKLITRESLSWRKKDQRQRIERFFSAIFSTPQKLSGQKIFRQEISFRPTLKQVKEVIKNFEDHATEKSIQDVGFKLSDQSVLMLSGVHLTQEITTEIFYQEDGFASIISLQKLINDNKLDFLSKFRCGNLKENEISDEVEEENDWGVEMGETFDLFGN